MTAHTLSLGDGSECVALRLYHVPGHDCDGSGVQSVPFILFSFVPVPLRVVPSPSLFPPYFPLLAYAPLDQKRDRFQLDIKMSFSNTRILLEKAAAEYEDGKRRVSLLYDYMKATYLQVF
jgi:hypothetical protein